ncbi:MAG: hypothetical protein RL557_773 [archaeon]|jgi:hypothetical protein
MRDFSKIFSYARTANQKYGLTPERSLRGKSAAENASEKNSDRLERSNFFLNPQCL